MACDNDKTSDRKPDERDTKIDDTPAVPDEPTDHAVARGRDVSLHNEGGHSPDNHSGVVVVVGDALTVCTVGLGWCWKPPTDRSGNDLSDQSVVTVSRTRCCKLHDRGARSTNREPTITRGAMLSRGVGGAGEASRKM